MKKYIALLLCISFLFCGCHSQEKPSAPEAPTSETVDSIEISHPEPMEKGVETAILDVIFFAEWVGGDYYILSYGGENQWKLLRFDQKLKLKTENNSTDLAELTELFPAGLILPDIERGQEERKLHCLSEDWNGKIIDETMGERYSVSPDLLTLCYSNPEKTSLIVESKDGIKTSYAFPGLVDLRCLSNELIWLNCLSPDYKNISIFFDYKEGNVLDEQLTGSAYHVTSCDNFALLQPSITSGNVGDPLYRYDFAGGKLREIQLPAEDYNFNIRLSSNGTYAISGSDKLLTIYDTTDFSVIAVADLEEAYESYENADAQTISDDGQFALIYQKGKMKRVDVNAVLDLK